jgi:beta-glucosidase
LRWAGPPFAKSLKNVAVIGPLADSKEATEGSWMVFGHTSAAVTVVEGSRAKLPGAKVEYALIVFKSPFGTGEL